MNEEDKFVILLGELHTEMTCYKVLDHWLEGRGVDGLKPFRRWSLPFVDYTPLPQASHVTRTRHAHLVITCVLYIRLKNAYDVYVATNAHGPAECFNMWCKCRKAESPHFLYWYTGFELELLALAFGHSLHPGDFDLYKDTLTKLLVSPWFFSFNHIHYVPWM